MRTGGYCLPQASSGFSRPASGPPKSIKAVNTVIKDHAPTLNNLAVILSQAKCDDGPSLSHYEQAITVAPVNQFILGSVTEALATIPDDERKRAASRHRTLFRKFTEQDTRCRSAHGTGSLSVG